MAVPEVGGYVLAGGKSSRMGGDKALLELAGKPLVQHAVTKLRRVCAEVHVLGGRVELEEFAPLVRDLHAGCGPLGGIEAALEHSRFEWNLFLPVDVPFLPTAFLEGWVRNVIGKTLRGARVAMFTVDDVPQSLFCLLHREVGPFVREAVGLGGYKVFPVLEHAAQELAARQNVPLESTFLNAAWNEEAEFAGSVRGGEEESWQRLTEVQRKAQRLWFANLNTPEEFAEAERHASALDT
jgi:molybdopterin-guanine dinucleotide biosynthesis protein A